MSKISIREDDWYNELSDEFKECVKIIEIFNEDPQCEAFRYPVDWAALGLYDYAEIIAKPMDFQTIYQNIQNKVYKKVKE